VLCKICAPLYAGLVRWSHECHSGQQYDSKLFSRAVLIAPQQCSDQVLHPQQRFVREAPWLRRSNVHVPCEPILQNLKFEHAVYLAHAIHCCYKYAHQPLNVHVCQGVSTLRFRTCF
jgi:hypothetical protein